MNCKNCENKLDIASIFARFERTIRRLWILCLVCVILLVGTNCVWIIYESQYEDIVITQENEDGYNNYIGNDGGIYNGDADD